MNNRCPRCAGLIISDCGNPYCFNCGHSPTSLSPEDRNILAESHNINATASVSRDLNPYGDIGGGGINYAERRH